MPPCQDPKYAYHTNADKYGHYNPGGCFRPPVLKMAVSSRLCSFPLYLLSHLLCKGARKPVIELRSHDPNIPSI